MTTLRVADDLTLARRGLRRVHYDALIATGLMDGEPVELLEGVLHLRGVDPRSARLARRTLALD